MAALLLDTHVFIWLSADPDRIGRKARARIDRSTLFLSVASAQEIGIKYRLNKIRLPEPPAAFVASRLVTNDIHALPISLAHALASAELPTYHHDPFDRMIIAQAMCDGLTVVTVDQLFEPYSAQVLWANA